MIDELDSVCDVCATECASDETQTPAEGEWEGCTVCNECASEPQFKGIRWISST